MRPGISFSAMTISLRPQAARELRGVTKRTESQYRGSQRGERLRPERGSNVGAG